MNATPHEELALELPDLDAVIDQAKRVATRYYQLTGRPLGITGEIGELVAARLLGLDLAPPREDGYDASRDGVRYQIKARCLLPGSKLSQRLGQIKWDKEWDAVLFVHLDEYFEPVAIYQAERSVVVEALTAPGSKSRNERGALGIRKFRSIGRKVWPVNQPGEHVLVRTD